MTLSFTGRKRLRKYFGTIAEVAEMPNLIEVQKTSYDQFLQVDKLADGTRLDEGLQAVFSSVFPIKDFSEHSLLEYVDYHFEEPKYDVEECQQRSMTYAAPLKVTLRLIVFDTDEETGAKSVKDIKEQDVYMGDIPFMTENGTFVINGTERVIVSQMHRSPGVFFDHDKGKTHSSRQAAVRRARHSLSRLLARFRIRRQGHHPCAHRPPPQAAGDDAALCARHGSGIHPRLLLLQDRVQAHQGWRLDDAARSRPGCATPRPIDRLEERQDRRSAGRSRHQDHRAHAAQMGRRGRQVDRRRRRGADRPLLRARHGQSGDRRDLCRSGRRADPGLARRSSAKRASTRSTSSMSTASPSAPISATPWPWTRTTAASRR